MSPITIVGAGPAGCAAALAVLREGRSPRIFEKSPFPRHKVCGEFLSPETAAILEELGAGSASQELKAARLARIHLFLGSSEKKWSLPEPAWGVSRFALDHLLLSHAVRNGAEMIREPAADPHSPVILAHGRHEPSRRGPRLFGFKAHFRGPIDDSVDLFFFSNCYVGVSAVEAGNTNVCGLAPENLLRASKFEIEPVLSRSAPLWRRLNGLTRTMDWLITGPLIFRDYFHSSPQEGRYPAGDALGFVDPFTGSGILAALLTGRMAGLAAARSIPAAEHVRECRKVLLRQYEVAGVLRRAIQSGAAEWLAPWIPGRWLFQLTRPRLC